MAGQAEINARERSRRQGRPAGGAGHVFAVVMRAGPVAGLVQLLLPRVDVVGVDAGPAARTQPLADEADAGEELAEGLAGVHAPRPTRPSGNLPHPVSAPYGGGM